MFCNGKGSCLEWNEQVKCHCEDGFQGLECEEETDECMGVVCLNQGTCVDHHGSFTCLCSPKFTGFIIRHMHSFRYFLKCNLI